MKLLPLLPLLALLPTLLLAPAVRAQAVHKCIGADGRTSFSDAPCAAEKKASTVKVWDNAIEGSGLPPREPAPAAPVAAAAAAQLTPVGAGRIGPHSSPSCTSFDRFASTQGGLSLVEANYASYMDLARACDGARAAEGDPSNPSCAKVRRELERRIDPGRADPLAIAALLGAQGGCVTDDLKRAEREARLGRAAALRRAQPAPPAPKPLPPEPPRMGPGLGR